MSTEVYNDVMTKVCNARFNEVVDNYIEQHALKGKGKLDLRAKLLAGELRKKEYVNSAAGANSKTVAAPAASAAIALNFRILLALKL